jgi:ferredoxin, 2Fe-2S
MARIVIRNLGKSVEVKDFTKSILHLLQGAHIDWMHACGGKGRCTTCKAVLIEGTENCIPLTQAELRYKADGMLREGERLACQTKITSTIVIAVPEEVQLPHMTYL